MKRTLVNRQSTTRKLIQLFLLCAVLLAPLGALAQDYGIIVNGETVTSQNKDDILKDYVVSGHIRFDGDHTLTLDNVDNTVFVGQYPFIQTSMDLTINLVGANDFDCGQSIFITRMDNDNRTYTVTFTTDATNPGMLTLRAGNQFNGFEKAFENGLSWMPDGYYDTSNLNAPAAWVAVIPYKLFIGDYEGYDNPTPVGVKVTSANASDIKDDCITKGTVSFDYESRTLTLTNATINGSIYSGGALTINLIGENYITAADSSAIEAEIPTIEQDLTIKGTGSLLAKGYSDYVTSGFKAPAFQDGQSLLLWQGYDENWIYTGLYGTQLFSGGAGTSTEPYHISTVDDLNKLAFYVNEGLLSNKFYELQNDIDCTNKTGFVPIGNSVSYPFSGTFNGNNKKIIGLNYTTTNTADYVGLFARVGDSQLNNEGIIKNLELKDCSFGGSALVGAIAGYFFNGSMLNCKVSGNTTIAAVGDGAEAGALIGNYYTGRLEGNYYYHSVTTSTQGPNDSEPYEISGYEQRGIGNADNDVFADDGAVMYTKQLAFNEQILQFDPSITGLEYVGYYNCEGNIFYFAPGQTVSVQFYPPEGYTVPSATLTYMLDNASAPTTNNLENQGETGYLYSFVMPDADASFIAEAVSNDDVYDLWIGNTQVTENNMSDVLGDNGSVTFTATGGQTTAPVYTLTLNNATLTAPITVGLDLTIDVKGTNSITVPSGNVILKNQNSQSQEDFNLTLKTSTANGYLTLTSTSEETIDNGGVFSYGLNKSIDKSLGLLQPNDSCYLTNGSSEYHTARFVPSLGVTIGGTPIYSGNAEDVFEDGKVSFSNNTLTLNGADLNGPIESNIEELTIKIAGNNSLTLSSDGPLFQSQLENATITIKQASNATGLLVASINSNQTGIAASNVTLNISQPLSVLSGELTKTYDSSVIIGTQLFSGGNGSADSPYLIGSTDDLLNFSNWVNSGAVETERKYFQLNDDIDFTNESGYNFQPVGYEYGWTSYPFKGTFNGNNKKIIGLNVSSNFNYAGLFGLVGSNSSTNGVSGSISLVTLENCNFEGSGNVGAVAGKLANGIISNCIVDGCTISASKSSESVYAGGIVGNCSESTTISGNRVKGVTTIYAESESDNVYSGAISGCKSGAFTDNLYYPTVITRTKVGNNDVLEKSGSQQRGIGEVVDELNDYYDITTDQGALLCYELTIGNNLITGANASNVFGDNEVTVSYDYDENQLTLNGATIGGATAEQYITVYAPSLTVKLIGDNTLNGGFELADNTARDLTFITNAATASLTMTNPIPESFTVTCDNNLALNETRTEVTFPLYGITIAYNDGTEKTQGISSGNRLSVLKEVTGKTTVWFNGNNQLVLDGATNLTGITVSATNALKNNELEVFLIGNNTITNTTGNAITYGGTTSGKLTFVTDGNTAGTLVYTNSSAPTIETAFNNFTVEYGNGLTPKINNNTLTIAESMPMTVDHEGDKKETDYSTLDPSESTNNVIKNGFLYTTGDKAGESDKTSGLLTIDGKTRFVFPESSAKTLAEVEGITADPCSPEYAETFPGVTARIPAGGVTVETSAWADANHAVMMKVAGQAPINISNPGSTDFLNATHRIQIAEPSTLQIYLQPVGLSSAPRMSNHRIGPKSSVAGALGGVKVTSNSIQTSTPPALTYKLMEKSQIFSDIISIGDVLDGYTCNDPDISDLPDDMFVDNSPSPAPRRGAGVKTILPDGLTFVNFSGTKITGMEVSREKGAFNGVPENVFIYMPAGNSVAKGTKNVVIGGICDVMELNGGVDAEPFKAKKNFKAGQATLKRTFEAYDDKNENAPNTATIYLPYAISQEDADNMGTFWQYESNDGTTVTMSQVTTGGLKANMPYIFKAKAGGLENPMVRSTEVVANPSETVGFIGVYVCKDYEAGMYCYAAEGNVGQFVEMGTGSYVPPFRAYMKGTGAPSYAILWDGVLENMEEEPNMTAVETVKTAQDKKTAEGWWTLNGVRLNGQPQKPGMYIVNGRLVVVK